MTDAARTPPAELASATFDGESTAAERAAFAASSTLGEEVSFYGDLRDRIADVDVPTAARESALAAALAVFDQIQTGTDTTDSTDTTDNIGAATQAPALTGDDAANGSPRLAAVVPLQQRRARQMRWLGGSVAAAFVAVFAVGVINANTNSNDKSASSPTDSAALVSSADQAAKSAPAPDPAIATESNETMSADAPEAEAQDSSGGAQATSVEPATDPSALFVLASNAVLDSDADVRSFVESPEFDDWATSLATGSPATTSPTADTTTALDTTADTTAASTAQGTETTAAASTSDAFSLGRACVSDSADRYAPALYRGTPVFVIVDSTNETASVIDAATCAVITTIAL